MARRKSGSHLGGHTVVHTNPDWEEIRRLEEKRARRSKEYLKALKAERIRKEALKALEEQEAKS